MFTGTILISAKLCMNRQIGQTFTLQGCCFIEEPYKIIRLYSSNS